MLIYESHVFQLRVETKLEVYDPGSFFDAAYEVTRKAWKIQAWTVELSYQAHLELVVLWRPAPSWPDSSTGRALHRHRRRQGSNPVQLAL